MSCLPILLWSSLSGNQGSYKVFVQQGLKLRAPCPWLVCLGVCPENEGSTSRPFQRLHPSGRTQQTPGAPAPGTWFGEGSFSIIFLPPGCCLFPFPAADCLFPYGRKPDYWPPLSFMPYSFWPLCFQAANSRPRHLAQLGKVAHGHAINQAHQAGLQENPGRMEWGWGRDTQFQRQWVRLSRQYCTYPFQPDALLGKGDDTLIPVKPRRHPLLHFTKMLSCGRRPQKVRMRRRSLPLGAAELGAALWQGCACFRCQRHIRSLQFRRLACPWESARAAEVKVIAGKRVRQLSGVWKGGQYDTVVAEQDEVGSKRSAWRERKREDGRRLSS